MPSIGQQPNPPTLLMVTLDTESPFSVRNYVWSGLNKTGALSCWSTLGCVKISPFVWIWLNGCQEDGGPGMSGLSVPGDSGDKVTRSLWHQWSGCCQLSEVGPPIRRSGCRLYWPIRGHRWVVWVVEWSVSPVIRSVNFVKFYLQRCYLLCLLHASSPMSLTASRVKVMTEPQSVKNNDLLETKTTWKYVILSRPKQE